MDTPMDPNLQAARLAAKRERLAAQHEREERNAKLVVLTPEERERAVVERNVQPGTRRVDPRKLKVKKEERSTKSVGKGWADTGKTARDKQKPPSGKKTNDPTISKSMKGKAGQKSNKSG